jgi:type IV secretory pathway TrbL component
MLMRPDATTAQFMAAAEILKRDMHNRKVSVAAELADVKARAGSRPGSSGTTTPSPAASDPLGIR